MDLSLGASFFEATHLQETHMRCCPFMFIYTYCMCLITCKWVVLRAFHARFHYGKEGCINLYFHMFIKNLNHTTSKKAIYFVTIHLRFSYYTKNLNAVAWGRAENLLAWYGTVRVVSCLCVADHKNTCVPTHYDMEYLFSFASISCNCLLYIFITSFVLYWDNILRISKKRGCWAMQWVRRSYPVDTLLV